MEAGLDKNKNDQLDSGEEEETTYVCDQPSSGVKILVTASILDGKAPQCSAEGGGTEFKIGLDKDGDNLLDPDEVRKTEYVCRTVVRTWKSISTKSSHVLGIKTDGTLWTWGQNRYKYRWDDPLYKYGMLGTASTIDLSNVPVQVAKAYKWKSISVGTNYSLAIRSDNTLWTWGGNQDGQLGIGTTTHSNVPVQIAGTWKSVSAGNNHSLGIQSDDTLWAWGNNRFGQLGDRTTTDRNVPVQIAGTWKSVSAGNRHSLAIRSDNTLWAWGNNRFGQLGNNMLLHRSNPIQIAGMAQWKSISAGNSYSLGIQSDDTLWTWGNGSDGRLGFFRDQNLHVPSQIGGDSWIQIAIIRNTFGTNRGPQDSVFKEWKEAKWQSVAAGSTHSLAIRSDGTLWAWGSGDKGELGFRSDRGKKYPHQVDDLQWKSITAGFGLSLGIIKSHVQWLDQTLWAWGYNSNGQLGDGSPTGANQYKFTPVEVKIP